MNSGPTSAHAVPMIGGMASSTLLTLLVIPAICALVKGWGLQRPSPLPSWIGGQGTVP